MTDEEAIQKHREFYNKFLLKINKKQQFYDELNIITNKFQTLKPTFLLTRADDESYKTERQAENLIKKYCGDELFQLFKERIKSPKSKKYKDVDLDNTPWLLAIFAEFGRALEELHSETEATWQYKRDFLRFIKNCLLDYGLHPDILNRNPDIYKRFNLIVNHSYRSRKPLMEYKVNLTYDEFDKQFIQLYTKQKPIKFIGKLIPFKSIHEVKITTSLLTNDEIPLFAYKNRFKWDSNEKDYLTYINRCKDETELYHPNPFDESTYSTYSNALLVTEVAILLKPYKNAHGEFLNAIDKYNKGVYQRNTLDDLRLSLELLLKSLFKNRKSLENQIADIGTYQKKNQGSAEVVNMFQKLITYYASYQNEYVKHNSQVKEKEVGFIFEITSVFIKNLLK